MAVRQCVTVQPYVCTRCLSCGQWKACDGLDVRQALTVQGWTDTTPTDTSSPRCLDAREDIACAFDEVLWPDLLCAAQVLFFLSVFLLLLLLLCTLCAVHMLH